MRALFLNALLVVFSVLVSLALGEAAIRLTGLRPLPLGVTDRAAGERNISERDPRLGFRPRPNIAFANKKIYGAPMVTTDRYGYRNGLGWDPDGTLPIIAFVGDSTTFAAEVADEDTGPSEVARMLEPQSNVRVLNAGARGYNTLQSKRRMEEVFERFPDVRAIVYLYTSNDYVENLNPIVYYPALSPTMRYDRSTGLISEQEIDPALLQRAEAQSSTARVGEKKERRTLRVRITNWLRSYSALAHHGFMALGRLLPRKQSARLVTGDGWTGPISSAEPAWQDQLEKARQMGGDEILRALLQRMNEIAANRGAVFLTTCFARKPGTEVCSHFAEQARQARVSYVDLGAALTLPPKAYASPRADGKYDGHFGKLGTKAFAEAIAPALGAALSDR